MPSPCPTVLESLLSATVVDEMTDSPSCKHSEAFGQGIANVVTGFLGGMAGCAMIGQSVINVRSGGRGEIFFVSVEDFVASFDFAEHLARVDIDLTHSHVWDASAVAAIDRVVLKFRSRGVEVELIGLNEASALLLGRLGTHDKPGAVLTPGH